MKAPTAAHGGMDALGEERMIGTSGADDLPAASGDTEKARSSTPTEFAALVFLTLPLAVFFAGFTAWLVAGPALLSIVAVLYRSRPDWAPWPRPGWSTVCCVVLSGLFLWACAYLPPFGRSWDWLKHFAIINELARNPWPPVNDETHTFLRYALGFYLMPGLVARLFGEWAIEPTVFLETWAGLFLVLILLLQKIRPSRPVPFLIVFLLFGGLDLVGWWFFGSDRTLLSTKEWWTGRSYLFAYEGHATLFLWVPQHALAGMLGAILVVSNDGRPAAPRSMGLLGAAVLFWSPFVAIGLLPFALAVAMRAWRDVFTDAGNVLCAVTLVAPLLGYLLAGSGDLLHGFTFTEPGFRVSLYAAFVMLEAGIYLVTLRLHGWRHLRYPVIVVALLIVIPLYRIGIYNDFAMRASIPALMLLAIAVAATVTEAEGYRWIPLAVLIVVGMAGSVIEIIGRSRDGYVSVRDQSMRSGFLFQEHGFFVQYNAPLPNWVLRR
ncbi:MAG: hypothetical protein ACLP1D_03130 [Xanthobacteraceae bacterium]